MQPIDYDALIQSPAYLAAHARTFTTERLQEIIRLMAAREYSEERAWRIAADEELARRNG